MGIIKYGLTFPDGTNDATIELMALKLKPKEEKFLHLRNSIDLLFNARKPDCMMWNNWTELMMETFCTNEWVTVTGSAASWKTTCAGAYVVPKWFSSPTDTVVIMTSVTLDGLRRRIWKEVTRYYNLCPAMGNLVQSRNCIQWSKGSDEAGIFGVATDKGEIDKAIAKIIGFHAPNIIIVVDEMQYVSEAIVEACVNLQSGCENFQFIGLGNADDPLDPHGRMCEPKEGWDSVTPEVEAYETKRGMCIHLDALKSPNVRAGKILYPNMINQRDIDNTAEMYGADSPQFWQMRRGWWPPEGVAKTVLSAPMIVKGKAREKVTWVSQYTLGAGLDPAFEGGDRCILRIGKCGLADVPDGRHQTSDVRLLHSRLEQSGSYVISLSEIIPIKVSASLDNPIHYQIATQVKEACTQRGIPPEMFALDSTGEGGGLASIIQREWSPAIYCVEFGGRPSLRPVSSTNPKRSDQEYLNRVTELWFGFRLAVLSGQIRDLDDETASEFCRRFWEMRGNLITVETKTKMKERTRKSPDLADAAVVLYELFRARTPQLSARGRDFEPPKRWKEFAKKRDLVPSYV